MSNIEEDDDKTEWCGSCMKDYIPTARTKAHGGICNGCINDAAEEEFNETHVAEIWEHYNVPENKKNDFGKYKRKEIKEAEDEFMKGFNEASKV